MIKSLNSKGPVASIFLICASLRVTVVCLFLLFILTFWGTIAQVQQGLYAAQERYFNSFFFLAAGFMPFPGAQLVLWVLFVNLICSIIIQFKKYTQWANTGLLITHLGIILYFFAAFMVFHVARESNVRLAQGEQTDVSTSYQDWELAYWEDGTDPHQANTFDAGNFKQGLQVPLKSKDFTLTVRKFYLNSDMPPGSSLVKEPVMKEREQNIEGGIFDLKWGPSSRSLVLYGAQRQATLVPIGGKHYYFILRRKLFSLPFTIRLDHFKAEFHPGTDVAKSFESLVTITTGSLERQVRIYMNNPLRYKDYTVYQASYDTDSAGKQHSTLAVVKNFARVLPYIACFVVFLGLALHFLIQAFMAKAKL